MRPNCCVKVSRDNDERSGVTGGATVSRKASKGILTMSLMDVTLALVMPAGAMVALGWGSAG